MPECVHNLLTNPVFGVDSPRGGREFITLPDVMARLSAGDPLEFTALRPHQTHAWHAFLVQLAAIVLHQSGAESQFPTDPERWREMLRGATGGGDEPWCLVVANLSRPAFMQPPVPERSLEKWTNSTRCPDDIDLLVTARNHDVKAQQIIAPRPEHWAYALVSLQTMEGYSGRNNYGIARMNSGRGNRPSVAVAKNALWCTRFVRDTNLLLQKRTDLLAVYSGQGLALTWLVPWDGRSQLRLDRCDPFFIEVCRRLRLQRKEAAILACLKGTEGTRFAAAERKGNLGDIWTPVRISDGAAMNKRDLSYKTVQEVVFGSNYKHSPASMVRSEDGKFPVLIGQVLARPEQGQTEGLHERLIPIPPEVVSLFHIPEDAERIAGLSKDFVGTAKYVEDNLLRAALIALIRGGPAKIKGTDRMSGKRCKRFIDSLDHLIDGIFFQRLFDLVDRGPDEAMYKWNDELIDLARIILRQAFTSVPIPAARRYRAIAAAEDIFEARAWKRLRDLKPTNGGDTDEHSTTTS